MLHEIIVLGLLCMIPVVIYISDKRQERRAREEQLKQKRRVRQMILEEDSRKLEEMLEVVHSLEKER